jgi:hypothetical protein
VYFGNGAWIISDECRLRVFGNRIPRRIFGPKRHVNGEWRRPHNEELYSLYHLLKILKMIRSRRLMWSGHVVRMKKVGMLSKF